MTLESIREGIRKETHADEHAFVSKMIKIERERKRLLTHSQELILDFFLERLGDSKSLPKGQSGGQTVYLNHDRYLHINEDECCFVLGYN